MAYGLPTGTMSFKLGV
jgi:hypothetical protein